MSEWYGPESIIFNLHVQTWLRVSVWSERPVQRLNLALIHSGQTRGTYSFYKTRGLLISGLSLSEWHGPVPLISESHFKKTKKLVSWPRLAPAGPD